MGHQFLQWASFVDIACWCACFWWMHRISTRQNAVLDQLRKQAERIERVSKEEHRILTELHPSVEAIEEGINQVSEQVSEEKSARDSNISRINTSAGGQ